MFDFVCDISTKKIYPIFVQIAVSLNHFCLITVSTSCFVSLSCLAAIFSTITFTFVWKFNDTMAFSFPPFITILNCLYLIALFRLLGYSSLLQQSCKWYISRDGASHFLQWNVLFADFVCIFSNLSDFQTMAVWCYVSLPSGNCWYHCWSSGSIVCVDSIFFQHHIWIDLRLLWHIQLFPIFKPLLFDYFFPSFVAVIHSLAWPGDPFPVLVILSASFLIQRFVQIFVNFFTILK